MPEKEFLDKVKQLVIDLKMYGTDPAVSAVAPKKSKPLSPKELARIHEQLMKPVAEKTSPTPSAKKRKTK